MAAKRKNQTVQPAIPAQRVAKSKKTGTRDAVETAIDLAKSDPSMTWEEQLARNPDRVTQWDVGSKAEPDR